MTTYDQSYGCSGYFSAEIATPVANVASATANASAAIRHSTRGIVVIPAGARFDAPEIVTTRGGKVSDVEVYFGWSIPHEAPAGGFVNPGGPASR
ncbi:MAG: hypothetical protein WD051_02870 [Steroidobacteraceae bacterium]